MYSAKNKKNCLHMQNPQWLAPQSVWKLINTTDIDFVKLWENVTIIFFFHITYKNNYENQSDYHLWQEF